MIVKRDCTRGPLGELENLILIFPPRTATASLYGLTFQGKKKAFLLKGQDVIRKAKHRKDLFQLKIMKKLKIAKAKLMLTSTANIDKIKADYEAKKAALIKKYEETKKAAHAAEASAKAKFAGGGTTGGGGTGAPASASTGADLKVKMQLPKGTTGEQLMQSMTFTAGVLMAGIAKALGVDPSAVTIKSISTTAGGSSLFQRQEEDEEEDDDNDDDKTETPVTVKFEVKGKDAASVKEVRMMVMVVGC